MHSEALGAGGDAMPTLFSDRFHDIRIEVSYTARCLPLNA
jgi:hypothetical protein